MDSMGADLMQGLETTLPTLNFDKERFCATLISGDIDEAEAYLSAFTKSDSNFQSNIMFYLLQRQKFFVSLINKWLVFGAMLLYIGMGASLPETNDFIESDVKRCENLGLEYEDALGGRGVNIDIALVARKFMDEMLEMMNNLVALNPHLQKKKKDISSHNSSSSFQGC